MRCAMPGTGWMQIVSDFEDQEGEIGLFRRLAQESSRPVTISMLQSARPARRLAHAAGRDRRGQRRGLPHHRPGALAADQRAAGLRAVAEPVHGPAVLQGDRQAAVRAAAGRAAQARVPRAHPARRRSKAAAANAASSAGTACSRSAIRRTTSPRPRAASPRGRRGKGGRRRRWPTTCCSSATAARCCTCRSPTTPPAISTWCAR